MAKGFGTPKDVSGENGIFDAAYLIKGIFISCAVSVVLLFAAAAAATYAAWSDVQIRIAVNVVAVVGLVVCGFLAARRARRMGLVHGAAAGVIYTVLLYIVGCLVTREMAFTLSTVTALLLGLVCGGAGGVIGINTRRRK